MAKFKIKQYENKDIKLRVTFRIGKDFISSSALKADKVIGSDAIHRDMKEVESIIKEFKLTEVHHG